MAHLKTVVVEELHACVSPLRIVTHFNLPWGDYLTWQQQPTIVQLWIIQKIPQNNNKLPTQSFVVPKFTSCNLQIKLHKLLHNNILSCTENDELKIKKKDTIDQKKGESKQLYTTKNKTREEDEEKNESPPAECKWHSCTELPLCKCMQHKITHF